MPKKSFDEFMDDLDHESLLDDDHDLLDDADLAFLGDLSEPDDEDDE